MGKDKDKKKKELPEHLQKQRDYVTCLPDYNSHVRPGVLGSLPPDGAGWPTGGLGAGSESGRGAWCERCWHGWSGGVHVGAMTHRSRGEAHRTRTHP